MSDEVSIQLDDHVEAELRFRVDATLRGGTINPNIVVKATALKQLLDERAGLQHRAEYLTDEINLMRRAMQHAGTWDQFCADYAAYKRYREVGE